jgi:hypothetical protein
MFGTLWYWDKSDRQSKHVSLFVSFCATSVWQHMTAVLLCAPWTTALVQLARHRSGFQPQQAELATLAVCKCLLRLPATVWNTLEHSGTMKKLRRAVLFRFFTFSPCGSLGEQRMKWSKRWCLCRWPRRAALRNCQIRVSTCRNCQFSDILF